jgi:hypothetical protein
MVAAPRLVLAATLLGIGACGGAPAAVLDAAVDAAAGDAAAGDAAAGEDGQASADSGADAAPDGTTCPPFSLEGRTVSFTDIDLIGGAPIYPDIAIGPDDQPSVAFTKGTASSRYAAVARFDGTAWSAPDPVEQQAATYLGKRPSLAVDAVGTAHVVAYDEDGCRPRYSVKPEGGTWTTTPLYLDSVDSGDHSCLVLDGAGSLHLTFTEYGTYHIVYGVKAAGDWQFETVGPPGGTAGASSSLAVDDDGRPHVAFFTGLPDNVLRYATRIGSDWVVEDADPTTDAGHYPSIALDPSGAPRAVGLKWPADSSELRLASRTDGGWQTETVDTGLGITYTTGLAVLPCGAVLAAYARNEGTGSQGLWLAHRNPGEADWTRTSLDATTYVSGIDLAVASTGRVHIVYFDETNYILKHAGL